MIDSEELFDCLRRLDKNLKWKTKMIAVGGTAMVLEKLKDSTKDIDFCVATKKDFDMIKKAKNKIKSRLKIDLWHGGYIFCLQLPENYILKSKLLKITFKNIELRILNPLDMIITKTSRLNQRDIEDIQEIIKKKRIIKSKLISRFNEIKESYPASEKVLKDNFKIVLDEFFKK